MPHMQAQIFSLIAAASLLVGCSAPQGDTPQSEAALRSGPALTNAALEGMYMSRTSDDPDGVKFVKCLDEFVLRFDEDAQVSKIFAEMSAETNTPIEAGNIAFFTDQSGPERYKQLVDEMIEIDAKTEGDIFNFDSSSTCVISHSECTLPAKDANTVRLYWKTIEHGSMGCFE